MVKGQHEDLVDIKNIKIFWTNLYVNIWMAWTGSQKNIVY